MTTNPVSQFLRRENLTRRDLNRFLGSAGLALVSVPMLSTRADAGQAPMVFEWSTYEDPGFHKSYLDKYGAEPEFSFFASQDEAFSKVQAGFKPDLVHPCISTSWKWYDAGFTKAIDVSRLSNWNDVWPALQTTKGVVGPDGKVVLVPFDWGNTSFCYRTDLVDVKPEDETWAMILDPKYEGKLSVDETEDNFRGVAFGIGIKDVINLTPEDMRKVKEALVEQKKLVRFYWTSTTELAQAMVAGEIIISTCWNETSAQLVKQGVPVKMANPKEGMITWVCGLVHVASGEGDEQLTYDFIDAFLAPESGAHLIEAFGYGHSNRKAFDMVKPERLVELGIASPEEMMARTFLSGPGQDFDTMMKIITEVQAGA